MLPGLALHFGLKLHQNLRPTVTEALTVTVLNNFLVRAFPEPCSRGLHVLGERHLSARLTPVLRFKWRITARGKQL